jgi:stearoyl-CoA desaturase (delta-9 desaturase)
MQYLPIILGFVYFDKIVSSSIMWWIVSVIFIFILTVYGFSIGQHHTFAHKTFKFSKTIETALIYVATCATLVSPITWTMAHFAHHKFVDTIDDPHSPKHLGWKLLFYYNHNTRNPSLLPVRHLLKNKIQLWVDSNIGYWTTVLSFPIICFLIGGINGLLFAWAFPMFYILWTGIIFTLSHFGEDNEHGNKSKNNFLLTVFSFGDGDHKTHHLDWAHVSKFHANCAKIIQ